MFLDDIIYEMDGGLEDIFNNALPEDKKQLYYDIFKLYTFFNPQTEIDTKLFSKITETDKDINGIIDTIKSYTYEHIGNYFYNNGIRLLDGLDNMRLLYSLLLFEYMMHVIDNPLKQPIVEQLRDEDRDNEEIYSILVEQYVNYNTPDLIEEIAYVSNSYLDNLANRLESEYQAYEDSDMDGVDELFQMLINFIKLNKDLYKTYTANILMTGKDYDLPFEAYLKYINKVIGKNDIPLDVIAGEIVGLLYVSSDVSMDDMLDTYNEYIDDGILSTIGDIPKAESINMYAKEYIAKLKGFNNEKE